jgi:hypothetical protein
MTRKREVAIVQSNASTRTGVNGLSPSSSVVFHRLSLAALRPRARGGAGERGVWAVWAGTRTLVRPPRVGQD